MAETDYREVCSANCVFSYVVGVANSIGPASFQVIKEPYEYICQVKGKGVRLLLINAFDTWLHIPPEKKAEIGVLTQMLHNASLL